MLPQKAQPGTNINYLSLFASKLGRAWHYTSEVHCRTPGAYRVFIIAFSTCQADGQRSPASSAAHWTGQVGCVGLDFTAKLLKQPPPLGQAVLS